MSSIPVRPIFIGIPRTATRKRKLKIVPEPKKEPETASSPSRFIGSDVPLKPGMPGWRDFILSFPRDQRPAIREAALNSTQNNNNGVAPN